MTEEKMTEQQEVLALVVANLEKFSIPYMVTGSLASGAYGEPRTTRNIDILIDPQKMQLIAFMRSFDERFYADESMALDALDSRGMFNVIDTESGWKIDLIIEKKNAHSETAFRRRQKVNVLNRVPAFTISPEDIVIRKLVWAKMGDSQRQMRDAFHVIALNPDLEFDYIRKWSREFHVEDRLDDLLADLKKLHETENS